MKNGKKVLGSILSISLLLAPAGTQVFAGEKDWGEYQIENDGYGYLTANFPAEYTSDYIIIENEVSIAQKVEALLLTMTREEKISLVSSTDGWNGVPRCGIPEIKPYSTGQEDQDPGIFCAASAFSTGNAEEYGTLLAEEAKAAGANMLQKDWSIVGDALLAETLKTAAAGAAQSDGVISGLNWMGASVNAEEMTDEELDAAAAELLTEIGRAGYLGMVQISRDGLVAVDADAPDVISLALSADANQTEQAKSLIENGAVLLKNEDNTLPLKDGEEAAVIYVAETEEGALTEEQSAQIAENLETAKQDGKKAVMVLETETPVDISEFSEDCDAVLQIWTSGEEAEAAVSAILSGEINPSGKLPVDWNSADSSNPWVFGYGLSYTSFEYELTGVELSAEEEEDYGLDVTVKVTNSGDAAGKDTVQLYLGGASDPEQISLVGFAQTDVLEPGSSQEMVLHVSQRGLSHEENGAWSVEEGNRTLYVAHSSADRELNTEVEIKAARAGASLEAQAPESAAAGEVFQVTVSTPVDVISLQMTNAAGEPYQPVDVLKENLGESITFTYSLQIDEPGTAEIDIFTTTAEGPSTEAAAVLEIDIQ